MPHGGPDWSTGGQISTVHTVEDLGELAARLGSIVTFDRRGNVIWMDDFESGIEKWMPVEGDAGAALVWSSEHARNGGFSAKLSTDDDTDDDAVMLTALPYPVLSRIGYEFSFLRDNYLKTLRLRIELSTDVETLYAEIEWTAATGIWLYVDDTGFYNLTPPTEFPIEYSIFNTVKLVADYVKKEYVRLIVNNTVFDLSGKTLWSGLPLTDPSIIMNIIIVTSSNDVATLYTDDVIITQNEP